MNYDETYRNLNEKLSKFFPSFSFSTKKNNPYIYVVFGDIFIFIVFIALRPKIILDQDENKNYVINWKKMFIGIVISTIILCLIIHIKLHHIGMPVVDFKRAV